jgi:hypothetical protein
MAFLTWKGMNGRMLIPDQMFLTFGARCWAISLDPDKIEVGQGVGCRQRNMGSDRMRRLR